MTLKHSWFRVKLLFPIIKGYIKHVHMSSAKHTSYIKSDEPLQELIYVKPPTRLDLEPEALCKLLKRMYGICDSVYHCHETFRRNLINDQFLRSLPTDKSLHILDSGGCDCILRLLVNDKTSFVYAKFLMLLTRAKSRFEVKDK